MNKIQFSVIPSLGILQGADFIPSPNFDARPPATEIDLLVIHGISLPPGEFGGNAIIALFTNKLDVNAHPYFQQILPLTVSSHLLIRRTGQVIQFVPFRQRAWHAGSSVFQGRSNCNDFSIGIELEGTDTVPYEKIQYQTLAEVTLALQQIYSGITLDRLVGHSDIAPGRKTDPGPAFSWDYFRTLLLNERRSTS